jgi:hypothetical protein
MSGIDRVVPVPEGCFVKGIENVPQEMVYFYFTVGEKH